MTNDEKSGKDRTHSTLAPRDKNYPSVDELVLRFQETHWQANEGMDC